MSKPARGVLDGIRCLIVGGTGGIGVACARGFLDAGARVVIAGSAEQSGAIERAELGPTESIRELVVDVADPESVAALVHCTREHFEDRLDALLHIAGISGRRFGDGPLHECSDDGWRQVFDINAWGVFLTNRAALSWMLSQPKTGDDNRGAIINVGSVVDRSPSSRHFDTVAYAASKGALRALTLASAARYAVEGVRFNLIEPGLVDTPMAARAMQNVELSHFRASKQPLTGGAVSAADVAGAAVYLASPAARAVTGATITVDGGWCVSEGQEHGP